MVINVAPRSKVDLLISYNFSFDDALVNAAAYDSATIHCSCIQCTN